MNLELNFMPDEPDENVGFILWVVLRRKENPHFTKKHHTVCYRTVRCKKDVALAIEQFKHIPNCRIYIFINGFEIKKSATNMGQRILEFLGKDGTLIKDPVKLGVSCGTVPEVAHQKLHLWDIDDFDMETISLERIVKSIESNVYKFLEGRPLDKRRQMKYIIDAYETKNGYHIITRQWNDVENFITGVLDECNQLKRKNIDVKPCASSLVFYSGDNLTETQNVFNRFKDKLKYKLEDKLEIRSYIKKIAICFVLFLSLSILTFKMYDYSVQYSNDLVDLCYFNNIDYFHLRYAPNHARETFFSALGDNKFKDEYNDLYIKMVAYSFVCAMLFFAAMWSMVRMFYLVGSFSVTGSFTRLRLRMLMYLVWKIYVGGKNAV